MLELTVPNKREKGRRELGDGEGTHRGFEQVEMSERFGPFPSYPWALYRQWLLTSGPWVGLDFT